MKIVSLIAAILTVFTNLCIGQISRDAHPANNDIGLQILCAHRDKGFVSYTVKVSNHSITSYSFPKAKVVTPLNSTGNIGFEVEQILNDSLAKLSWDEGDICTRSNIFEKRFNLDSGDAYIMEVLVPLSVFQKSTEYRVRIVLKGEFFQPQLNNAISGWFRFSTP